MMSGPVLEHATDETIARWLVVTLTGENPDRVITQRNSAGNETGTSPLWTLWLPAVPPLRLAKRVTPIEREPRGASGDW